MDVSRRRSVCDDLGAGVGERRRRRAGRAGPSRCQSMIAALALDDRDPAPAGVGGGVREREADAEAADERRAGRRPVGGERVERGVDSRRSERPSEVSIRKQPLAMIWSSSPCRRSTTSPYGPSRRSRTSGVREVGRGVMRPFWQPVGSDGGCWRDLSACCESAGSWRGSQTAVRVGGEGWGETEGAPHRGTGRCEG